MSISAVTHYPLSARSAAVARTIPGVRRARENSCNSIAAAWNESRIIERPASVATRPVATIIGDLTSVALALPRGAAERWRMVANGVVAYLLVLTSLAIVHIPFVVHASPFSLAQANAIFWTDVWSRHVGHLVLYGTLLALLSYAGRLLANDQEDRTAKQILRITATVF